MHNVSIRQISKKLNRNYSTIYNVVMAYLEEGHTNRSRNYKEKMKQLKFRQLCKERRVKMLTKAIQDKIINAGPGAKSKYGDNARMSFRPIKPDQTNCAKISAAGQHGSKSTTKDALSLNLHCPLMVNEVLNRSDQMDLKISYQPIT